MRQLIVTAVFFLIAACTAAPVPKWSDKPLSEREQKALAAVINVYKQSNISVLDEYGTERQVVGAQMTAMPGQEQEETQGEAMHEHHAEHMAEHHAEHHAQHHEGQEQHHDMHEGGQTEGHLVTLVTRALIKPQKEYSQPVITLGEDLYFMKIIYIATVDDRTLTMRKTVAREDADQRIDEPVEPALLKSIAASAGGTLVEDRIMLP
jgi:hypothetical protein